MNWISIFAAYLLGIISRILIGALSNYSRLFRYRFLVSGPEKEWRRKLYEIYNLHAQELWKIELDLCGCGYHKVARDGDIEKRKALRDMHYKDCLLRIKLTDAYKKQAELVRAAKSAFEEFCDKHNLPYDQ